MSSHSAGKPVQLTAKQAVWALVGTGVLVAACCAGAVSVVSGGDPAPAPVAAVPAAGTDAPAAAPSRAAVATLSPSASPSPSPSVVPTPSRPPAAPATTAAVPATDKRYRTCQEVLDAGRGPYVEGTDPEYAWYRDADNDGTVCESGGFDSGGSDSGGSDSGGADTGAEEPESVYYKNCTAVRAAGADPIRSGDPGYGRHLDRDGDGVGCE